MSKAEKNISKDDVPKLNLFPKVIEEKKEIIIKETLTKTNENKKSNNINEEKNKDKITLKTKKDNTNDNNPFSILVNKGNKNNDKKENNEGGEKKSLFGDIFNKKENKKNESLFGNNSNTIPLFGIPINDENKDKSLFNNNIDKEDNKEKNKQAASIFANVPLLSKDNNNNYTNEKQFSLFGNNSGKSLFGNNENKSNNVTPILFQNLNNNNNATFLQIKGDAFAKSLFDKKDDNNKKENSEKKGALFEGDEDSEKSDEQDKPKTNYVAEPLKAQDYSEYSKFFNLNINNLFLYNKIEKKYVSKGSGFFSLEKTKNEKNEKPKVVVVYRNHAGNKLVEGFLDSNLKKFDILNKDFDYVVCFGIVLINEGKPDIRYIKIPFKGEETANELKQAFEKGLDIIEK